MAVQLVRTDRAAVLAQALLTDEHRGRLVGPAVDGFVRSLLIGVGLGISLVADHPGGVVGVAAVGVIAIGAALASWQP